MLTWTASQRRRTVALGLAILLVLLPAVAIGDAITVGDPADVKVSTGLDIVSIGQSHSGAKVVHTVRFEDPVPEGSFHRGRWFVIVFDTDLDLSDPERLVYVFSRGTSVVGLMTFKSGNEHYDAQIKVTHPTSRSFDVSFDPKFLGKLKGGYRWFVYAESPVSRDSAPNRRWRVHDIVPPEITMGPGEAVSGSADLKVGFTLTDPSGLGVKAWDVYSRPWSAWDDSAWTHVAGGAGGGHQSAVVPLSPGDDVQYCVTADDAADNPSGTTYFRASEPRDDTDAAFAYSGAWSTTQDAAAYMGTLHTTSEVGAKVTLPSVDGIYEEGWLVSTGSSYPMQVQVRINGSPAWTVIQPSVSGPQEWLWMHLSQYTYTGQAPYTVELVLLEGTLGFDGVMFPMPPMEFPPLVGWKPQCGSPLSPAAPLGARDSRTQNPTSTLPRSWSWVPPLP